MDSKALIEALDQRGRYREFLLANWGNDLVSGLDLQNDPRDDSWEEQVDSVISSDPPGQVASSGGVWHHGRAFEGNEFDNRPTMFARNPDYAQMVAKSAARIDGGEPRVVAVSLDMTNPAGPYDLEAALLDLGFMQVYSPDPIGDRQIVPTEAGDQKIGDVFARYSLGAMSYPPLEDYARIPEAVAYLKQKGFDGVVMDTVRGDVAVVFNSSQISSS